MSRTTVLLLLLVGVLAIAWLSGTGPRWAPPDQPPRTRVRPGSAAMPIEDVTERTARLHAHQASPPPFAATGRNPFAFRDRPPRASRARDMVVSAMVTEAPPAPQRPVLVLQGIAADEIAGRTVRTAVITADGQLLLAKEGDRLLSRFRVARVGAEAVQLEDETTGETLTIALK